MEEEIECIIGPEKFPLKGLGVAQFVKKLNKENKMNLNKVLVAGNIVRDPEKFDCKQGGCRFTLAVSGYKDSVTFIPCTAFGKTAELILKYCTKGKPIFIEGAFSSSKSGEKTYYSVIVNNVQFLSGGSSVIEAERVQSVKPVIG